MTKSRHRCQTAVKVLEALAIRNLEGELRKEEQEVTYLLKINSFYFRDRQGFKGKTFDLHLKQKKWEKE